jgi:hypothetical protein
MRKKHLAGKKLAKLLAVFVFTLSALLVNAQEKKFIGTWTGEETTRGNSIPIKAVFTASTFEIVALDANGIISWGNKGVYKLQAEEYSIFLFSTVEAEVKGGKWAKDSFPLVIRLSFSENGELGIKWWMGTKKDPPDGGDAGPLYRSAQLVRSK